MTRKKVDLTYITNETKRKAAFKKRKTGLIKKIDEVSTLCGIEACAIIYSPTDPQPEVWPSQWGVQKVLSRFRRMPEMEQSKKMLNQESFLNQRILKAQEQLNKQRNDNRKKEIINLMFQCLNAGQIADNVSMNDVNDLSWLIDHNIKEIERKVSQTQAQDQVAENNGAQMVNGGDQQVDHAPMVETNVDAMQQQLWSMNFINGADVLPFGDVNVQNDLGGPNPQVP